ncbi:MAG: Mur ligase family protein, partial [Hydrogenophilus sp.]
MIPSTTPLSPPSEHALPESVDAWLARIEARGSEARIVLGLERVRAVWQRLWGDRPFPHPVITVAGTNGKGSTCAYLEAIYRAAGYRVGCYTSPHLVRFHERIRVGGVPIEDAALIAAFTAVETARDTVALTYFEFVTLAALWHFAQTSLDLVILEVGMGGRLDAVNLIDPDVAIVTTVDLDHQAWLGPDREAIGREKAGIFRTGRPAIVADPNPPQSLLNTAHALAAPLFRIGA